MGMETGQDAVLAEIVRRIVDAVDPDKIILFGSRARGDNRPDSDFDLLVIKDSDQPKYKRAVPAHRSLTGVDVSVDIIWRTPSEVADWSGVRSHVIGAAVNDGTVLYEMHC